MSKSEWPPVDPPPVITNRDLRPAECPVEPLAVRRLTRVAEQAGWPVLVGYSRGPMRTTSVGVYKDVMAFGVWANLAHGWRWYGIYERTVGAKTKWKWSRITIWRAGERHAGITVTGLNEFLSVRGSVTSAWFGQFVKVEVEE